MLFCSKDLIKEFMEKLLVLLSSKYLRKVSNILYANQILEGDGEWELRLLGFHTMRFGTGGIKEAWWQKYVGFSTKCEAFSNHQNCTKMQQASSGSKEFPGPGSARVTFRWSIRGGGPYIRGQSEPGGLKCFSILRFQEPIKAHGLV